MILTGLGRRVVHCVLLSLLLPLGAAPSVAADTREIVIAGTGDSQALLQALGRSFEISHPDIHIIIPESIGSSGGIRAVVAGKSTLGRIARPLSPREAILGLNILVFARSPVVFMVNRSVDGVDSLDADQVRAIFDGRITSWSAVGGAEQKIYLVNREPGDSSRRILEQVLPGFGSVAEPPGSVFYSTPEAIKALVMNDFTIGYGPIAMAESDNLRVLNFNHQNPRQCHGRPAYPLFAPFALIWQGPLDSASRQFIEFLSTRQAQEIMRTFGVCPVPD